MSEAMKLPERLPAPHAEQELPARAGEKYSELSHEQPEAASERLESARQTVEQAERQSEAVQLPQVAADEPSLPQALNADSRRAASYSALQHIRRRLPAPERALSRIVHQPAVQAVSELGGKTISRPSGLLGGGLCAFLGSSAYLYLTKHIGFRYNYLLFLAFFVGGFAIGLLIELLVRLVRFRQQQS